LRVTSDAGEILHLRPSGNAPELRCYAEADSPARAQALVAAGLERLRTLRAKPFDSRMDRA
jgi:phosphomannomutase